MPLFAYACKKCAHEFEALVFPGEEAECPKCRARQLEKRLSVPARPSGEKSSPPSACNSTGPPCGPGCGRFA
jgi:putative FmdB family regulatory protein